MAIFKFSISSWWFQPIWKILVKMGILSKTTTWIFYHVFPFETSWKFAASHLFKNYPSPPPPLPPPKKKLLSVAPWFQNSIDITKTLLFCSFYCLFCLGKVSQKKPKELPLSGQVFPFWRLEVPSLQRSLLRARYSKVLKVKNMPFRIH